MALTVILFGLGGLLVGGAISLRTQQTPNRSVVLVLVLAVMAITGGALRLFGS